MIKRMFYAEEQCFVLNFAVSLLESTFWSR